MKHIKTYKIFESNNENIKDIIHECFIPVEDLTNVYVLTHKTMVHDITIIEIYDLNSEICEEVANAVSHCIGMGLYFIGAIVYYHNRINRVKSFTSNDIEEFYNFMTARNLKYQLKIEFKKDQID